MNNDLGDMVMRELCGTCVFHVREGDEWVCTCEESDNYGLETNYEEFCFEWEER